MMDFGVMVSVPSVTANVTFEKFLLVLANYSEARFIL